MDTGRNSVSPFLLIGILSISARFTPELCRRFSDSRAAADFFMDVAQAMVADEMWRATLDNTQAFFLLGLAYWGRGAGTDGGDRARSAVCMGIAVRMAGILRLHREETYRLPEGSTADDVVKAERGRRTFWVIQNHEYAASLPFPLPFLIADHGHAIEPLFCYLATYIPSSIFQYPSASKT